MVAKEGRVLSWPICCICPCGCGVEQHLSREDYVARLIRAFRLRGGEILPDGIAHAAAGLVERQVVAPPRVAQWVTEAFADWPSGDVPPAEVFAAFIEGTANTEKAP